MGLAENAAAPSAGGLPAKEYPVVYGAIAQFEAAPQSDPSQASARRNLESVRAHLPKP